MTYLKKSVSIAICVTIVFLTLATNICYKVSAAENKLVHIFGTDVNFRSSMSSANNNNRIGKISNDYADLISESGYWLYINYNYNGKMTKG